MIDPLNHLGSIWYHSEPVEVSYSPNQFLGWDFFAVSYSKLALELYYCDLTKKNLQKCNQRDATHLFWEWW